MWAKHACPQRSCWRVIDSCQIRRSFPTCWALTADSASVVKNFFLNLLMNSIHATCQKLSKSNASIWRYYRFMAFIAFKLSSINNSFPLIDYFQVCSMYWACKTPRLNSELCSGVERPLFLLSQATGLCLLGGLSSLLRRVTTQWDKLSMCQS